MSEMIAVFRGSDDVRAAMQGRRDLLEMSMQTLDRLCGWKSGQAAKYLADPPIRGLSIESAILMAAGLGGALAFVEHDQSMAEVVKRGSRRQANAVRAGRSASMLKKRGPRRIIRHMAHLGGQAYGERCDATTRTRIAAKGGRARAKALDRKTRSKIAKNAAVIRWELVKAAVKR